ncbi:adenylate kinase [Tenacibaculum phage pT24]|uniref:Adenylate kinase n=1 Tax=Tenacibaculum phage pT24 TaxID=1880590 RepID=A0A1B4XWI3_9CAUD|nr:adenylate kinase [Tenacibaculum phage pT24]BAV39147.1 adenylate kinase [Tenacibaculum phage pT24]
MKSVLLIGKPACGKGTQSEKLKKIGYIHIGMGDILRRHKKDKTEIGLQAIELDKEGKLMPNDVILKIMRDEITRLRQYNKPFIFDGVCRTIEQFEYLKNTICRELNIEFEVIYIHVNDDTVISRSLERGKTSGRIEDSEVGIIKKRLEVYEESTLPILNNIQNAHVINGEDDIYFVTEQINNILGIDNKSKPRLDLMLDIETLGKEHEGLVPITSISAIGFDNFGIRIDDDLIFETHIDIECYDKYKRRGLDVYPQMNTIMWWMKQNKDSMTFLDNNDSDVELLVALMEFKMFYENLSKKYNVFIYCKSPDFDTRIINEWLTAFDYDIFMVYNKSRCIRTIIDEWELRNDKSVVSEILSNGVHYPLLTHKAYDDCLKQICEVNYCRNNP